MFAAVRFSPVVIVGVLFCTVPCFAQSQRDMVCQGSCGGGCGPCSGSSSGGSRSRASSAPSAAEIAAQKAYAQNEQGLAAYKRGDWATAEAFFRKSLEYGPNDPVVVRRNLANAQNQEGIEAFNKGDYTAALNYFQQAVANAPASDPNYHVVVENVAAAQEKIDAAQREQEQRQQDKLTANNMQQSIRNLAQTLSAAPSSGGLDFMSTSTPSQSRGGSAQPSAGGSTPLFGVQGNPSNPDLDFSVPAPTVPVHNALDQLNSAANSGAAATSGSRSDQAKVKSNCAFDTGACATYKPARVNKTVGQTPGAAELAKHIPKEVLNNDTVIQQSMAYYQKLDGLKIETKTKLAAVQQQINSGTGDPKALSAQRATLTNDLKRYNADQANTEAQIKEHLKSIHVAWDEGSTPGSNAGAKTTQ